MRRAGSLCTAIFAFALCGLMLTGCEKGNESTGSETEISEDSASSESVSETVQTEAETAAENSLTEAVKKEYDPVPKSTLNYDKVKERIVFKDGENTLTAGQYIDALENCEDFTGALGYQYIFQIMDIDENGIPEVTLARDDTVFVCSNLYTVTAAGEAVSLTTVNQDICYNYFDGTHDEFSHLRGGSLKPYEKNGETVWLSGYNTGGAGGGSSGTYILKYDGSVIDGEIIRHSSYERYPANEDWLWDYSFYYNVLGEDVTEEEYDLKYNEYLDSLQPSDALYTQGYIDVFGDHSKYDHDDFKEMFCYTLNRYLDMRDGTYKDAYTQLADKKIGDIAAREYVEAVMSCEDLSERHYDFQLADINGDGMPEVIAYNGRHFRNYAKFFSVSPDKKAAVIPVLKNRLNEQLEARDDHPDTLIGKWVRAYKKDGETVWVGSFENRDTDYEKDIEEVQGDVILKLDGKAVSQEILREHDTISYLNHKYYWRGEKTSAEEYERLYREFIWSMEPLPEIDLYSAMYDCNRDTEQKDLLAAAVLEYIENS